MVILAWRIEYALDVPVERSHYSYPRKHRWAS
jgi:hypothetical protein